MTHTTLRRHRRTAVLAALLIAGAAPFALAACSSGSDASTAKDTAAGVGAKWGSCMRDAGFTVQDPSDADLESGLTQSPPGSDQEEFGKSASSCREKAGVQGASDADKQKWEREYAKVASCIRERGYPDFPEQEPGVLDVGGYARGQEPGFQKVMQACTEEFSPDTKTQNVG